MHTRVNSFKAWAKANHPTITEENDNGEWCFCNEFYDMEACSIDIISNTAASGATEQMIDDLLYVIARDNECEIVMDKLEEHNDWFSLLCRRCLNTGYANAIWQFAKHLPNYKGGDDLKKIIYDFLDSGDEYTERMALRSLVEICPEQAERYAVKFWEREKYEDDEYQKIMVLHVLHQIRSTRLPHYLALASQSAHEYLRRNAAELYVRLNNGADRA